MTPKSKDYDCGGETVGVAIEAVRTLKSPSESERFTIPTKQKSASTQRVKRFFVLLIEVERLFKLANSLQQCVDYIVFSLDRFIQ